MKSEILRRIRRMLIEVATLTLFGIVLQFALAWRWA